MSKFGFYRESGGVGEDASEDVLTGRALTPEGSVRERVPGTRLFYRVHSGRYADLTDEQRAQVRTDGKTAWDSYASLSAEVVTEHAKHKGLPPRGFRGSGVNQAILKDDLIGLLVGRGITPPPASVSAMPANMEATRLVKAAKSDGDANAAGEK